MRLGTVKDAGTIGKNLASTAATSRLVFTEEFPAAIFSFANLNNSARLCTSAPRCRYSLACEVRFCLSGRFEPSSGRRSRMQPNPNERRMMRRFDMRLPAVVLLDGGREFRTETQNVSARGVYFYLDRPVTAGSPLEVTLTFPPHITLTDPVRVRFRARVIRVEKPLPSLRIGTAAMIEEYEFLRTNGNSDLLSALQKDWKAAN